MAAGQGDPMNSPTSSGRKVRAGLFEIDLAAGQLHKNGRRLPLRNSPFAFWPRCWSTREMWSPARS